MITWHCTKSHLGCTLYHTHWWFVTSTKYAHINTKKNCFNFFCTQISRLFLLWLWIIVMLQFYWLLIIKKFSHSIQKIEWCDKKWNFSYLRRKMGKNYVIERRRCFSTINEENIFTFKAIVAMRNMLGKRRGGECLKKLMKNILLA